jgi:probable poly-beta-1,6-N-acetyl-D-glucosamine export protein
MFLRYVHNFRAVAIVIIVAGHAITTLARDDNPRTADFLLDMFANGTVLFVFIAGFLFEHLSRRYEYRDYLRKKLLNVIVPYLLVSIPAVLYTVLFTDPEQAMPEELGGTSAGYQALWMLLTGGGTFNYAVWFVPMITLFYLAAPLFMQCGRWPRLYLVCLVLVPLSMLAHRPPEVHTPAIALYFLPAYLLGMWASHDRARLEPLLDRWWPWLLGAFGAAVLARFLFSPHHGNEYASRLFSGEFGLFDWMLAQKLLLCFAMLGLMRRLDDRIGDRLRFLGDISFTIFFVHCYMLFAFLVGYGRVFDTEPQLSAMLWLLLTVGTVAATAGGTLLAKRLLGRRSRYLIGS